MGIQAKPKQCVKCPKGTLKPIWKNILNPETGKREPYCKIHSMSIAVKANNEKNKEQFTKDEIFYDGLWNSRPHFCFECGCELKVPKDTPKNKITFVIRWFMHHCAPKAKYKYLRHIEEGIVFLCIPDHAKAESAISYPKMKRYKEMEAIKHELIGQ